MKSKDLADRVGITVTNLSILKTGKAKEMEESLREQRADNPFWEPCHGVEIF